MDFKYTFLELDLLFKVVAWSKNWYIKLYDLYEFESVRQIPTGFVYTYHH